MPVLDSVAPIGRDPDLAAIAAFVPNPNPGARAFILVGEAGVGKTSIWAEAVARTAIGGTTALVARPTESERDLAFAGLADLFSPVADAVLPRLPPPQRRALEVALLLSEPETDAADPRAVGSAVASALRVLAADGPIVIAIDDAPWLDASTTDALAFALRRTGEARVRVLATVRLPNGSDLDLPGPLLGSMAPDVIVVHRVDGISLGALGHLLRERVEQPIGRPALIALHAASRGNPFVAIEMARASIRRSGGVVALDPPILEAGVDRLVADRISRLPAATRGVLLLVAAEGQPLLATVRNAAGTDPRPRLAPAIDDGIVAIVDGRVRFSHPLYAAATYGQATQADRAIAHRALAAASRDPVQVARHLALGTPRAHASTADAIERGARLASDRGAPAMAADLMTHARRLTPSSAAESAWLRAVVEADLRWTAGDLGGARALLEAAIPHLTGRQRAEASLLLGVVVEWLDGPAAATSHLRAVLREGDLDPEVEAAIHLRLATTIDQPRVSARHAAIAATRLAGRPTAALDLQACAALLRAEACILLGRGASDAAVRAATGLLERHRGRPPTLRTFPAARIAYERIWIVAILSDELTVARRHLVAEESALGVRGWDRPRTIALADLSFIEAWLGDLDAADDHARASRELVEQLGGTPYGEAMSLLAAAQVAAVRGDAADARLMIGRALAARSMVDDPRVAARLLVVQGFVELGEARWEAAASALDEVAGIVAAVGERDPADLRYEGDRLEAAVALGRTDVASAILADLEARRRVMDRPWLRVMTARGASLLAAAAGDPRGALDALDPSGSIHAGLEIPLERGRTLLAEGRLRRRLREKRQARVAFAAAAEIFEAVGARRWAAIAAEEAARTGMRPASSLQLTETERRVAELAARGRTNRDVAQALFLSPKSVDGVLIRVYQKLGIHSRAELGALLGRSPEDGASPDQ